MPKVFPFPLYRSSRAITSISSYSSRQLNFSKKRKIRRNYSQNNNNIRMAVAATRRNLFQTNCSYSSRKSCNLKMVTKISSHLVQNKSLRQIITMLMVKSSIKTTTVIRRRQKRSSIVSSRSHPGKSSLNNNERLNSNSL